MGYIQVIWTFQQNNNFWLIVWTLEIISFKIKRHLYKGQQRRRPEAKQRNGKIQFVLLLFSIWIPMFHTEESCVMNPGLVVSSNWGRCGRLPTAALWPEAVYLASRHPCVISMSLNISGTDRVSGSHQRRDSGDSNTKQEKPCDDSIIDIRTSWQSFYKKVNKFKDPYGIETNSSPLNT